MYQATALSPRRVTTSFAAFPIRDHAFFEQVVLKRKIGNAFLQGTGFPPQILDLLTRGGTGRIAHQAALARLNELLRPDVVIQALGEALFTPASASRKTPIICSSSNRIRFVSPAFHQAGL